ncbi:MAG: glutathione S-transferase family protein [Candidatus Binataceae bacterium]
MAIRLYDLAAADESRRFSPFCWRTKMALAHKGLAVETTPWHFTEKQVIAFANSERVPVIVDNGRVVADSWTIANYLESAYPGRPSLFGGAGGQAMARFFNCWADIVLQPAIAPFVMCDLIEHLAGADRDYFRHSREARFKTTLEQFCAGREQRLDSFRKILEPMHQTLVKQPYFGGGAPLYPDYIVFGSLQWPRAISAFRLLEPSDPIDAWRQRMLDAFGGVARGAPGYW